MQKKNERSEVVATSTQTPTFALDSFSVGAGLEELQAFMDRRLRGIPTGWAGVDKRLMGLGNLVVLQGAPGSNKSTAALQIAHFNARRGCPAFIVDEENGRERTRTRLLCQLTGESEMGLQAMRHERPPQFAKAMKELGRLPMYIGSGVVNGQDELHSIAAAIVGRAEAQGSDFGTLVVDSIQSLPRVAGDERENLECWLKHLDRLKLEFGGRLLILATSEKNYASFDEASLRGGKGSSAISYKGETILDFVSRPEGIVRVTVVKNRDGVRGVSWEMELQRSEATNPESFNFTLAPVGELPG